MRFGLIACRPTSTNDALSATGLGDLRWEPMTPHVALGALRAGDVALGTSLSAAFAGRFRSHRGTQLPWPSRQPFLEAAELA
jgi:hypothetical protein